MTFFSTPLLYDAAFVLILLVSITLAAKCGAFKAISGIAGTVAGLVGGLMFQDRIAVHVESFLTPMVERTILSWDFSQFMELSSETIAKLSQTMADVISAWQKSSGGQIPQELVTGITGEIVPRMAAILSFLLLFFAIKIVVVLVLRLFNDSIPGFRTLSRGLGAVLGAVSGLLLALVLCWAVLHYAPADEAAGLINQQSLRESHIGSVLCTFFD